MKGGLGMGRGVVWDLGVINPLFLSLTSSWCRNNLALRDSPSLAESPRGFLMAVCMQDGGDTTFWWLASPSSGAPFPPFLPWISCRVLIVAYVVTVGT